jgi:hypothetical protein
MRPSLLSIRKELGCTGTQWPGCPHICTTQSSSLRRRRSEYSRPATSDISLPSQEIRSFRFLRCRNTRDQIRAVIEAIPAECPITKAGIAIPYLPALYQDDLADAAEYAKIQYLPVLYLYKPVLWETSAAFAGYSCGNE